MEVFINADEKFEWKEDLNSQEWDNILSSTQGHLLQSAKWGDSKKLTHGINYYCWAAFQNGVPIYLVRFEERRLGKLIKLAWAPKGPVVVDQINENAVHNEFLQRLKKRGYFLCATNPWKKIELEQAKNSVFYTIWIDLNIGKEKLWGNLHKQFRYDVRRAKKLGVVVEKSKSHEDVNSFYTICKSLSRYKGFHLCTSIPQMTHMLKHNEGDQVESYLFSARHNGSFCGGAFAVRCGENIHYMWGAVDRAFAHLSIGEALQWEIIEWALSMNCKKYDLEGISPKQNSGVDYFKKKLGGSIIVYPSNQIYPLHRRGKLIAGLLKIYLMLQPKLREYKKYFSF